jgi:hypothetical protein
MTRHYVPNDRADVESCREFAREIFGLPRLLDDVRPTYADLDYLRAHGEHFPGPPGLYGHRRGNYDWYEGFSSVISPASCLAEICHG